MAIAPRAIEELERQLAEVEALPETRAREVALQAITGLTDLYGAALGRVLDLAPDLAVRFSDDELLGHLLVLHGLHPQAVQQRVETALDSIRPYLATHGGNVELLSVTDGVVQLRLAGTCNGCPSSTATLHDAIQQAIGKFAPDIDRVEAEGVSAPTALISVESLICPLP